jgi:hypothetical protein
MDFANRSQNKVGVVVRTVVKPEQVLSTPRTGFGCLDEWEFVLHNKGVKQDVIYVENKAEPIPSQIAKMKADIAEAQKLVKLMKPGEAAAQAEAIKAEKKKAAEPLTEEDIHYNLALKLGNWNEEDWALYDQLPETDEYKKSIYESHIEEFKKKEAGKGTPKKPMWIAGETPLNPPTPAQAAQIVPWTPELAAELAKMDVKKKPAE